jgi:hypothetical protein
MVSLVPKYGLNFSEVFIYIILKLEASASASASSFKLQASCIGSAVSFSADGGLIYMKKKK